MIPQIVAKARSLWFAMRKRSVLEAQMHDEFQLHIELRARDLERSGLSAVEATRQARAEFGTMALHKEEARAARGLKRIDSFRMSWLDFKLGFRMLQRYPGLTIVGGLAMAFAICIGAASFELITQWVNPRLPLYDGSRVVGVQMWNAATLNPGRLALSDFENWRREAKSVVELSAFRVFTRNLGIDDNSAAPVDGAELNASAFAVARVSPIKGRVLLESDEQKNSPLVAVVSYDVWQQRYGGDAAIIGRTARLNDVPFTIVGVMPRGFAFPRSQDLWIPLRLHALDFPRDAVPSVAVTGRLAAGVSMEKATQELVLLWKRGASDDPDTHKVLSPKVLPYASTIVPVPTAERLGLQSINGFVVLLIILVCSNVALLLFARAATRESEIVLRNALGASRARIVTQLFTEAIVLGALGAIFGLSAATWVVRMALAFIEANLGRLPFWYQGGLSLRTFLYAGALVLLCAIVAGVLPGLKVTRNLGTRLQQASNGGGGLKFGRLWMAVIVAQVAVTVTFPMGVFVLFRFRATIESLDLGFKSSEYLSARLEFEGTQEGTSAATDEMLRRLEREPAVSGVSFTDRLPGMYHDPVTIDAIEGLSAPTDSAFNSAVHSGTVGVNYLDVLGAGALTGRNFTALDVRSHNRVVIVNQTFVQRMLRGQNAVGRRVRFLERRGSEMVPTPWFEIIGVTKDLGMNYLGKTSGNGAAGLYFPQATTNSVVRVVLKTNGAPRLFAARLQSIAYAVNPAIRVSEIQPMNEHFTGILHIMATYLRVMLFVSAMALMLSLAGIYAALSFAVSRRTREIGIRMALGASARRVVTAILRPTLIQIAIGVAVGGWLVAFLAHAIVGALSSREIIEVVVYAVFMMGVCMLACMVPTWRALSVEPTEALRGDG